MYYANIYRNCSRTDDDVHIATGYVLALALCAHTSALIIRERIVASNNNRLLAHLHMHADRQTSDVRSRRSRQTQTEEGAFEVNELDIYTFTHTPVGRRSIDRWTCYNQLIPPKRTSAAMRSPTRAPLTARPAMIHSVPHSTRSAAAAQPSTDVSSARCGFRA